MLLRQFFRFILGALRTLRKEGVSGIPAGFRYWKSTSPFLANLQSKKDKNVSKKSVANQVSKEKNKDLDDDKLNNFLNLGRETLLAHPLVSIIILTYDQVDYLQKCLKSIQEKTCYDNYEIIIVTNNLDPNSEMRAFLSTIKYSVEVYEKQFSFGLVNNYAISKSKGEFCVFLNDDTEIISKDWIENLLLLATQDDVGAVGGKILYPNGKLQEAGGIVWNNGNTLQYGKLENPDGPEFNFVREVDYCSSCFLLVKKTVFEKIGGFDPRFNQGYYEDTDLCLAFRQNNFRVLYQPLSKVVHYEGKTFGRKRNLHEQLLENKGKFIKKRKNVLDDLYVENSDNVKLSSDKRSGTNILIFVKAKPESVVQSSILAASILSYLGNRVTMVSNDTIDDKLAFLIQQHQICFINNDIDFLVKKSKMVEKSIVVASDSEYASILSAKIPYKKIAVLPEFEKGRSTLVQYAKTISSIIEGYGMHKT